MQYRIEHALTIYRRLEYPDEGGTRSEEDIGERAWFEYVLGSLRIGPLCRQAARKWVAVWVNIRGVLLENKASSIQLLMSMS